MKKEKNKIRLTCKNAAGNVQGVRQVVLLANLS
jgi:hypothetical protein